MERTYQAEIWNKIGAQRASLWALSPCGAFLLAGTYVH